MERIYDSSALLNLLLSKGSKALPILSKQATLDLAMYELGNSIWKISSLHKKITKEEACKILSVCVRTMEKMEVMRINGIEDNVKGISLDAKQSFYDSAYVALAQRYNLELVTDDKNLQKVASKYGIPISSTI